MDSGSLRQDEMSYVLYRQIADDLCSPVDPDLDLSVRLELCESKVVYLRNLYEQAFVDVNRDQVKGFDADDLARIRQALNVTTDFMRESVLNIVRRALDEAALRQGRIAA
jgi:hypothetical protein